MQRLIIGAALVAALAIGYFAGQARSGAADQATEDKSDAVAVSVEQSGELFARRGPVTITYADIDGFMRTQIPEKDRAGFLQNPSRIAKMIDNLLARYGVAQRALSDGMLGRDGLDAEILHKAVNSLFEAYVDRYVEARMLDDYEDQAREDYLMDPDRYKGSETATFRHLLVVPAKSGGEATAMEQVLELNDRIVENPGEFGSMIAEYSQDPLLAENGGNYEQIEPSMLEPRIVSTLEELEPGAISGPVRTQHGWHFVQLESWNEATVPDYEEVRQQYVDQARKDHRAEIHRGLINEMLSEDLELPEGAIAELLSRYGADAEVSNADLQTRS